MHESSRIRREPEEITRPARLQGAVAFLEDSRLVVELTAKDPPSAYDRMRVSRRTDCHFVADILVGHPPAQGERELVTRHEFYPANVSLGAWVTISAGGRSFELMVQAPPARPGLPPAA